MSNIRIVSLLFDSDRVCCRNYALRNVPLDFLYLLQSKDCNTDAVANLVSILTNFQYVKARCALKPDEVYELLSEFEAASKIDRIQQSHMIDTFNDYHSWLKKDATQISRMPTETAFLSLAHNQPDATAPAQEAKVELSRGDSWCGRLMGKSDQVSACIHNLSGHTGQVNAVAWSTDGGSLASASREGAVWLWNAFTGSPLGKATKNKAVTTLSWNQESELAAGLSNSVVRVWNTTSGSLQPHPDMPKVHSAAVVATAWTNTSATLASTCSRKVQLWDATEADGVKRYTKACSFQPSANPKLTSLTWIDTPEADGVKRYDNPLALGGCSGIYVWNPVSGEDQSLCTPQLFCRELHKKYIAIVLSIHLSDGPFSHPDAIFLANELTGSLAKSLQQISSLSWNPNNQLLAAGTEYGHVMLWMPNKFGAWQCGEIEKKQEQDEEQQLIIESTYVSGEQPVRSVAWSADSRRLAFSCGNSVRLLCHERKVGFCLINTFDEHTSCVNSVTWSPDSTKIASGSDDCTVKVWDIEAVGGSWHTAHSGGVFAVAVSPDCKLAASTSYDKLVKVWDVLTNELQTQCQLTETESLLSVAWDPTGEWLAIGLSDGAVKIWSIVEGQVFTLRARCNGHTTGVISVAWSAEGSKIASGAKYGVQHSCGVATELTGGAIIWDVGSRTAWLENSNNQSEDQLVRVLDSRMEFNTVVWSPNGDTLLTVTRCKQVKLWNALGEDGKEVYLDPDIGDLNCAAWSPNSERLALGHDNFITTYSVTEQHSMRKLQGHLNFVKALAWSPCGCMLVSGSGSSGRQSDSDNTIRIWNADSGVQIKLLESHKERVNSLAWSADGQRLVSGSRDHSVRVWDVRRGLSKSLEYWQR